MLYALAVLTSLTSLLIIYSFYVHKEFFPSVNYLFRSKLALSILGLQGLLISYECLRHLSRIFVGRVLTEELAVLKDKLMFLTFEFGILMSVHPEGSIPLFIGLCFLSLLHWLFSLKVESLQRMARVSRLVSYRLLSLFLLLGAVDVWVLLHFRNKVIISFETALLFVDLVNSSLRALIILYEFNNVYLELFFNFAKSVIYVMYTVEMSENPFVMLTLLSRAVAYISKLASSYRTLINMRNMEQMLNTRRYDVSSDDLVHQDMCLICRETMTASHSKKLDCGHLFHLECVKLWLRQHKSCPTCRREIDPVNPAYTSLQPFTYQPIFDDVLDSLNEEELKLVERDIRNATVAKIKSLNGVNALLNEVAMRVSLLRRSDEVGESAQDVRQNRIDTIRRTMGDSRG